ncbi:MAG TPA: radical SAM protein [Thermodesulfobacteriota bacterium]|nr:radical SAM protein [Thermodesulfobacteriota bacterium]
MAAILTNRALALDITLTSRCPLQCRYCSVERKPQQELSARQWESVIASFARLRRIELISLEGGEPFVRPDLPAILAASLDGSQAVKIVTSGVIPLSYLPERLLRNPRLFIELSMDGPREFHDFLRDGSWEKAWPFLQAGLERGVRMRLRSVISRHNLFIFEGWPTALDRALEPYGQRVEFSFDTILAPEAMVSEGGEISRLGLRAYPTQGLLPSPAEIWRLYRNLKCRNFRNLVLLQTEPLRGCGAAAGGFISFDPAGIFSFCCEAPRGVGSIFHVSAEECLSRRDISSLTRPCENCPHLSAALCNGCWTGQKCGMVKYWGAEDCQALVSSMDPGRQPRRRDRGTSLGI